MKKIGKISGANGSIDVHPLTEEVGEPPEGERRGQTCGDEGAADGDGLECRVHHLSSVAGAAPLKEVRHVVATRELGLGNLLAQELAQGAPSVADAVFQQVFLWHEAADLLDVILVDLFALAREVAAEEGLEELREHGIVHAGSPAEVRRESMFGVSCAPVHGLHHGTKATQKLVTCTPIL